MTLVSLANLHKRPEQGGGGGGTLSLRETVVQSACQYDVTSRVSDFQNGEQSVHRRDGRKYDEILFRFLGFGYFKVPFVIEN